MSVFALPHRDVVLVGAGIIGLSIAVELHARGAKVLVLERDTALRQASIAAAGMLAANDPHNPPGLLELSQFSVAGYGDFLSRVEDLSGQRVPYQTDATVQYLHDGSSLRLQEHSVDPRQLASALGAAARAAGVEIREHASTELVEAAAQGAGRVVIASGAWAGQMSGFAGVPVVPRKGQMLRVQIPAGLPLRKVHRSERVYVVPRTLGPQAGTAIIGATIEDAGFDTATHQADLSYLRRLAAELLPQFASGEDAPMVEAWAGLRPATPDGLPVIGEVEGTNEIFATGHFRNGILLAPGTAKVIADVIEGKQPPVNLEAFSPTRFALAGTLRNA